MELVAHRKTKFRDLSYIIHMWEGSREQINIRAAPNNSSNYLAE